MRNAPLVDQSVSSKARRAAAMARSMSSWPASAVVPSTSSVAGLTLSNRRPEIASSSFPSMSIRASPVMAVPSWVVVMVRSSSAVGWSSVHVP